jgi:phosphoenolpyruvate carboxylase
MVSDIALRERIFSRLRGEWEASIEALLAIMGQKKLETNPLLARSIRNRFPYGPAQPHADRAAAPLPIGRR